MNLHHIPEHQTISKKRFITVLKPFPVCPAAAPCSPEILNMTQTNSSAYRVLFTTPNNPNTKYTITAIGHYDTHTCWAKNKSCDLTQLPCGSTYEVTAVATTDVGRSLPGFSKSLETGTTGYHLDFFIPFLLFLLLFLSFCDFYSECIWTFSIKQIRLYDPCFIMVHSLILTVLYLVKSSL